MNEIKTRGPTNKTSSKTKREGINKLLGFKRYEK